MDGAADLLSALEATCARPGGFDFLDSRGRARHASWAALRTGALTVCGGLRALGTQPGEVVGLALPTGEEFFHGLVGAMMAGAVPAPLPSPATLAVGGEWLRSAERLRAAGTRVVLTTAGSRGALAGTAPDLAVQDVAALPAGPQEPHAPQPEDAALLQFSSGTTGEPRAVALSHRAIVWQARAIVDGFGAVLPELPRGVCWLPLNHDMGLVGCGLSGLVRACPVTFLSPRAFLGRPALWLRAISNVRATVSPAPGFAYALATERIRDEELAGVDLSCWRVALCGAETVVPAVLRAFAERFRPWGFREEAFAPAYGLAEAGLAVSMAVRERPLRSVRLSRAALGEGRAVPGPGADGVEIASVGGPLAGFSLQVRGAAGEALPEGRVGDVWVRGPSLMTGYHRQPQATREVLVAGWLDTGDRGFLQDGELHLTGRRKDVLVVRGRNYPPQVVEEAAEDVPGVRRGGAAAVGRGRGGATEELVLLVEHEREVAPDARAALGARCAAAVHTATSLRVDEVAVVAPGALPRTTSGKLRRGEALSRYGAGTLRGTAAAAPPPPAPVDGLPRGELAAHLLACLARLRPHAPRGEDEPLELDSIEAAALHAEVQERYGVELPFPELAGALTALSFADLVLAARPTARTGEPEPVVRVAASAADLERAIDLTVRTFTPAERAHHADLLRAGYEGCTFFRPERCFLVEASGVLAAKCQFVDQTLRLGRAHLRAAVAQALAVEPSFWGHGHPALLAGFALPRLQAEGFDLALGYTGLGSFGGFQAANVLPEYEISFEARPTLAREGGFRPLQDADVPRLLDLYHQANRARMGSALRPAEMWPWLYRRPPLVLLREDGYLGVRSGAGRLDLLEVAGEGDAFHAAALGELVRLARAASAPRVAGALPPDHPFLPHAARAGLRTSVLYPRQGGAMVRLLDASRVLAKLTPELESRVPGLRVRLVLHAAGQSHELALGRGAAERLLQVDLPPLALAPMIFGYRRASLLAVEGGATLTSEEAALLDQLFPQGYPFVWPADRF